MKSKPSLKVSMATSDLEQKGHTGKIFQLPAEEVPDQLHYPMDNAKSFASRCWHRADPWLQHFVQCVGHPPIQEGVGLSGGDTQPLAAKGSICQTSGDEAVCWGTRLLGAQPKPKQRFQTFQALLVPVSTRLLAGTWLAQDLVSF